jgi:plastocyanin
VLRSFSLAVGAAAISTALLIGTPHSASAQEQSVELTIKDHRFEPARIEIPANTKVKLVIKNADASPEEFEMNNPKREKVIKGGQQGELTIGPLKPGTYDFVGEFNPKTARGQIVVK